ncbi:MAG: HU family DNA-binding protein [Candidatus Tectomicrobia bacterium]
MTKAEFVARVAAQIQLPQKQTDVLLAVFLTSIIEALRRGEHVELRGFGSFRLRDCLPREGRNPKTGESVSIPAKRVPFFKVGKDLRERVDHQ